MIVERVLLIIIILCTMSLLIIHAHTKYEKTVKKYYIPFGNKNFYFNMSFDDMFDIEVPYRQLYNIKENKITASYKVEIDYIYSIIKYIFLDEFNKPKILKAVEVEMECDNFIDAKNTLVDVKKMLLDFYGTKLTYNEFEENKKERTFLNSFGIKTIDFNIEVHDKMLNLSMNIK